ncbi:uncharacterized protein LOC143298578 [Babylonia areolata]|uniref:uncharacterized protein LOC143298578 n=1 Tax=Babylonia areolata TaxID=304850 RepID=UPI003FCFF743
MQDSDDSDRPQRRSALVARELAQLDIDIAALSEIRFAEQGSLTEEGAGYTLYWSGKSKTERRLSGVGFMIKSSIASKLHSLPVGHSDRIMSLRLPLTSNCFVSLFSVYAPTLQADAVTKEAFYSELSFLLRKVDKEDKILIMGDFNARVGRDHIIWPGVIGRHGIGNCNDNGRLLLEFCTKHSLSVTNTLFQQKARYKTTWKHPRSKHWHLLDYVLVRQRDIKDVLHTRVMPSADCYTDHRLVCAKVRLTVRPAIRRRGPPTKKLNVQQLLVKEEEFRKELEDRLKAEVSSSQEPDPEEQWQRLKTALQNSAADVAGFSRKNRDWFDENDVEIQNLIQEKRASHVRLLAIQDSSIEKIPQLPVKHDLDNPPLFEEVKSAIKKLKGGKAPGIDGLPAEVYVAGGDIVGEQLTSLFTLCWDKGVVPGDLRDALQEKCREQNMGLYAAFVDLTKAFDTVSRDRLWKVLTKLGCPPKFLAVLKQLHEDQRGQVKCGGELSEPFPIGNGVKQGCVLPPHSSQSSLA